MRPSQLINIAALWLVALPLYAQVEIKTTETKTIITTTDIRMVESTIVDKDGTVVGDPITIEQNETSSTKEGPKATLLSIVTDAANVQVEVTDINRSPLPVKELADRKYLLSSPVKQWVDILAVDFAKNIFFRKMLVIEAIQPQPPQPPDPQPPDPQPPIPPPSPAPIEGEGLRVLFVSESSSNMPPDLGAIFFDKEIQDWLNAHCVKVDGQPDFRRVDPDTKFTDSNHRFAKALARPRRPEDVPWLIASNGTTNIGFEGPFPKSKDELWAILKRIQGSIATPSSALLPAKITMFTTDGCEPCQRFLKEESLKLKPPIQFIQQKGGSTIYPAFKIEVGSNTNFILGFTTADALLKTVEALQ